MGKYGKEGCNENDFLSFILVLQTVMTVVQLFAKIAQPKKFRKNASSGPTDGGFTAYRCKWQALLRDSCSWTDHLKWVPSCRSKACGFLWLSQCFYWPGPYCVTLEHHYLFIRGQSLRRTRVKKKNCAGLQRIPAISSGALWRAPSWIEGAWEKPILSSVSRWPVPGVVKYHSPDLGEKLLTVP